MNVQNHGKKKGHQASTRHPKNPKKPIENYIVAFPGKVVCLM